MPLLYQGREVARQVQGKLQVSSGGLVLTVGLARVLNPLGAQLQRINGRWYMGGRELRSPVLRWTEVP